MEPILDYDPERRILHVTAAQKVSISTRAELDAFCKIVTACLTKNSGGKRSYMIVNMSVIVIDPDMISIYSKHLETLVKTHLYPRGLLRYGLAITRVTARGGHTNISEDEPLFFYTKEEAFAHVQARIQ